MTEARPWVRGELPWLRSGPLFRVHSAMVPTLDAYLQRWSYRRVRLDGRRMTSRVDAHTEIAHAFGFPGYYGKNWDAFNDCFGDYLLEHSGDLVAVLWTDLESAARAAPATTAEVAWALLMAAQGGMSPVDPAAAGPTLSMDVFVIGAGTDFDRER
ncbi:barstar family protein [Micromonospora auratinigra]|uniref:Barstar (Barnase inhibitor) n=1 Tax=Micromonospora auratinigra TaxID=261654 RepID=A0A1A9A970_9ACTN|nr:barstar family protein [Micromonospora auratinigra]SBT53026.1 Barstar (barnase inhibitor) [Micromonospora auratinigra]